jgi:hypothetical protein
MNITNTQVFYGFIFIVATILFFIKLEMVHKQAYVRRIEGFAIKALSLSVVGNVLLVLFFAHINGNEDMVHLGIVILAAILFDLNYYLYCKRRMTRYRDAAYHDITNDIRIK